MEQAATRQWILPVAMLAAFLCGVGVGSERRDMSRSSSAVMSSVPVATAKAQDDVTSLTVEEQEALAAAKAERARQKRSAAMPIPPPWNLDQLLALASRPTDELRRTFPKLSTSQLKDLINQLSARPATSARNEVLKVAFGLASAGDPAGSLRSLDTMPGSIFKAALIGEVLDTWAAKSPEAAARWMCGPEAFELFDVALPRGALPSALMNWAYIDAPSAAKFIAGRPHNRDEQTEDFTVRLACAEWGRNDPQAALDWAASLPADAPHKNQALSGAVAGMVKGDPRRAAAFVQQHLGDEQEGGLILAVALTSSWAETDPQAAVGWINSAVTDKFMRTNVLSSLMREWIAVDTQAAADWAAAMPADEARGEAWRQMMIAWSTSDPRSAARWISRVSASADRDDAITEFITMTNGAVPMENLALVQTISEPKLRASQLRDVLSHWFRTDQTAAAQ